jgi:hypothetical protein
MKIENSGSPVLSMTAFVTDPPILQHAMKSVAQVGLAALFTFQHVFKATFGAASYCRTLTCAMRHMVVQLGFAMDSVSIDSRAQCARQSHQRSLFGIQIRRCALAIS